MPGEYKIVYEGKTAEIIEKKSRFIATVAPVHTEEEAAAFVESMRKKYWNASHNCFAYVIGERCELQRFSDDGEPGGTAGKPMLDVLAKEGLHDTAVVVTRYFGGTLLGTGGLVRAYSQAVKAGLHASVVISRISGIKLHIGTDYASLGKIQYILAQKGIMTMNPVYTDKAELTALIPDDMAGEVKKELTEGTNGQADIKEDGQCHFANINGEMAILSRGRLQRNS